MEDLLNLYELIDVIVPNPINIPKERMLEGDVNLVYTRWKCWNWLVMSWIKSQVGELCIL